MKLTVTSIKRWFAQRALKRRIAEYDKTIAIMVDEAEMVVDELAALRFDRKRAQTRLNGLSAFDLYFGTLDGAEPAHLVPKHLALIPSEPAPTPDEYGFPRTVPVDGREKLA